MPTFKKLHYWLPVIILVFFTSGAFIFGCTNSDANKNNKISGSKPNIIFILTDDFGWGDLGVLYQNQRKRKNDRSEPWQFTPNLDQLANDGALLPHHYTAAPVCAPSRASLLLGVSQGHANVRDNQFDKALADNHTIASVLREAGYATAAFGKWGLQGDTRYSENGDEWPARPRNRGFDYFLGYMRHRDGHEHYPKEGIYRGTKQVWQNDTNITPQLDKTYTADLWTAGAKKWITDHNQSKSSEDPFFVYLAYDTPHAVLELPTQAYPRGGGRNGGLQWTGEAGHMINTASGEVDSWVHPDYSDATYDHDNDTTTAEVPWPEVYQRYATANRRIDSGVGDIRRLLKDLDIAENTMIVFTSDNGPSRESYLPENEYQPNKPTFFNSFGPFDGIKRDTWEGGIRMPAVAAWGDKIPAGETVNTPSINYDWLPTFADAAGLPAPANSDGVSLLPSLTGVKEQQKANVYIEYYQGGSTPAYEEFITDHRGRKRGQMQVLRMDEYVGVRYNIKSASDDFEIYNVIEDPQQKNNLSQNDGMASLQQKMKTRVLQMRRPNTSAPRPYDDKLVSASVKEPTTSGLHWKAFDGDFPWVPNVASLEPDGQGITKNVASKVNENENQVLYFYGYLDIPSEGQYSFYLSTDDSAVLRIHQVTVIDGDAGLEEKGAIKLARGLHPFKLTYLNRGEESSTLTLQWEGPNIARQTIPTAVFRKK